MGKREILTRLNYVIRYNKRGDLKTNLTIKSGKEVITEYDILSYDEQRKINNLYRCLSRHKATDQQICGFWLYYLLGGQLYIKSFQKFLLDLRDDNELYHAYVKDKYKESEMRSLDSFSDDDMPF